MPCALYVTKKLSTDDESVESSKSLERVDLLDVPEVVEHRNPSFVAFRCHHDGSATPTLGPCGSVPAS